MPMHIFRSGFRRLRQKRALWGLAPAACAREAGRLRELVWAASARLVRFRGLPCCVAAAAATPAMPPNVVPTPARIEAPKEPTTASWSDCGGDCGGAGDDGGGVDGSGVGAEDTGSSILGIARWLLSAPRQRFSPSSSSSSSEEYPLSELAPWLTGYPERLT